jgi:hypothetical protein
VPPSATAREPGRRGERPPGFSPGLTDAWRRRPPDRRRGVALPVARVMTRDAHENEPARAHDWYRVVAITRASVGLCSGAVKARRDAPPASRLRPRPHPSAARSGICAMAVVLIAERSPCDRNRGSVRTHV